MIKTVTHPGPSAVPPTDAELAAWQGLSREEQLARYRDAVQAPEAQRASAATMADVLNTARQRVAARRG